jgi:hypothetical protein
MPALGLTAGTLRRSRGNLPQLRLSNMIAEQAITEPTQFMLFSRPGLVEEGTELGSGPIDALFQQDGVLSGYLVAVSGGDVYVNSGNVGTLPGSGHVSIAGNQMGIVLTAGTDVRFYDGSTFRTVAFPDGASVSKVQEQGGRFVFWRKDTHRYYWTEPLANMLDGSGDILIDGLDFASAENEPDKVVDGLVFEDHLIHGGSETIEFHGETGNDDAPWSPTLGRVFNKGVRATGCMALWNNVFAWVSPDNVVYSYGGSQPSAISDAGIQELIAASATCVVDSFFYESHEFLRVRLDTMDLWFDALTGEWAEHTTTAAGPALVGPVFGSTADGKLLEFGAVYTDLGATLTRLFRFGMPIDGGAVPFHNVLLRCNPGQSAVSDPVIGLRWSRDGGNTWSSFVDVSLGNSGEYRTKVEWRSLGLFDAPGALFEAKVEDAFPIRVSGASFNEFVEGRSRG